MPTDDSKTVPANNKPDQRMWIAYVGIFLAGIILLGDAYNLSHLAKWTARVGVALIFSAVALIAGKGRPSGYLALIVLWTAVLLTIFL